MSARLFDERLHAELSPHLQRPDRQLPRTQVVPLPGDPPPGRSALDRRKAAPQRETAQVEAQALAELALDGQPVTRDLASSHMVWRLAGQIAIKMLNEQARIVFRNHRPATDPAAVRVIRARQRIERVWPDDWPEDGGGDRRQTQGGRGRSPFLLEHEP